MRKVSCKLALLTGVLKECKNGFSFLSVQYRISEGTNVAVFQIGVIQLKNCNDLGFPKTFLFIYLFIF